MHNAPAVSFPVGRSHIQVWFLSLAWLAGAAACGYWGSVTDGTGWRHGLALAAPVGAGVMAWWSWARVKRQIGGTLRWDGSCWRLEMPAAARAMAPASTSALIPTLALAGDLAVHLDFQSFMLLSLRLQSGGVRWMWLHQSTDLVLWQALRRAVHT